QRDRPAWPARLYGLTIRRARACGRFGNAATSPNQGISKHFSTMALRLPKSRANILALQQDRKVAAVKNALRAPFHQQRLAGIDPERVADPDRWREIPLLLKEDLRALSPQQFHSEFCLADPHEIAEY